MRVSPEQVRKALVDLLADPQAFKSIFPALATAFPVEGAVCGSKTDGQIPKFCDSGGVEDSVIKESSAKIGIGTTTPHTKLEVIGAVYTNAEGGGVIVDAVDYKRVGFMKYSGIETAFVRYSGTSLRFGRTSEVDVTAGTSGNFTVEMVITGTGEVGIGTASPAEKLEVEASSSSTSTQFDHSTLRAASTGNMADGFGGSLRLAIKDSGADNDVAALNWRRAGADNSGALDFWVNNAGTFARVMTLDKSGSVIFGATSTKQVSGGPELISAQGPNNGAGSDDKVVLWSGLSAGSGSADTEARFLFSYRGFLEWGAGGTSDQDVALFRNGAGGISVGNFYAASGGSATRSTEAFRVNAPIAAPGNEGKEIFAVDSQNVAVRVARGDSGTGTFTDSESFRIVRAVKTTNDTPTTIATITLGTPRAYYIVVRVVGRKDSSNRAFFTKSALANREGGAPAVDGTTAAASVTAGSGSTWACNVVPAGSGNDVLIQVTGEAANVYWVATVEYQSVSTDS